MYRIIFGRGEEQVELTQSQISEASFTLDHSQLSSWSLVTHYDPDLTGYADTFAPIVVLWDDEVLFRGHVTRHKRTHGGPGSDISSTLEGHCRGFVHLLRDVPDEIIHYESISARDAIEAYWRDLTPFDATVHEQPLDNLPDMGEVELTDDHLANLQKLHERANFVFTIDHQSSGLEVTSMSRGQLKRDAAWELDAREESTALKVEHEDDRSDYANIVIARGGRNERGERLRYDAVNSDEVQRLRDLGCPEGVSCATMKISEPDVEDLDELQTIAETELSKAVEESKTKGKIDIVPTWVQPGYAYDVEALGEDGLVLESVDLSIGSTDASASLDFVDHYGYANDLATLRGQINRITDSI